VTAAHAASSASTETAAASTQVATAPVSPQVGFASQQSESSHGPSHKMLRSSTLCRPGPQDTYSTCVLSPTTSSHEGSSTSQHSSEEQYGAVHTMADWPGRRWWPSSQLSRLNAMPSPSVPPTPVTSSGAQVGETHTRVSGGRGGGGGGASG
jgi:hypothetical protein